VADIRESIGKMLAFGEKLREATETGRHRVPAGVDDLRVGQYQINKSNVEKIVWHLVYEKRRIRSLDTGSIDVFPA
jgi:hypothetical protein